MAENREIRLRSALHTMYKPVDQFPYRPKWLLTKKDFLPRIPVTMIVDLLLSSISCFSFPLDSKFGKNGIWSNFPTISVQFFKLYPTILLQAAISLVQNQ